MTKNNSEINPDKNTKPKGPPPPPTDVSYPEIFSSRKHSMDYVTVDGVVRRTGYADKSDWYLLLITELLDNAIDFLWKNYAGANDAFVMVEITINDSFFHIKVRNMNSKNIQVFQNLPAILDYDMHYGSKQNQHIISRGLLGDATKQISTWPYVLIHSKDDGSAFTNKQWEKPLIIRSNRMERQVLTHVDKANQIIEATINRLSDKLPHTDTMIETTWPIIDEVSLDIRKVERLCRQYIIFTTDILFKFRLVDNSTNKIDGNVVISNISKKDFTSELVNASTSPPARKAEMKIDAPALHSISTKWNNISTIHSYSPEEFVTAITSVYDQKATTVYDVLRTFKEGTQMAKTPDTQISVEELMQDPDKDKKIELLFHQLKQILKPPEKLSLPYSHIKPEERKKSLIDRITQLYPKGYIDTNKGVYRLIHENHKDSTSIVHYPFAFEIIAIPLSDDVLEQDTNRPTEFIGSVNYSISPRGNIFEGNYEWYDKKGDYTKTAHDIKSILSRCGFEFYAYSGPKVKLPCIIAANLVSPRIDYHGQAKSRIDTRPFSSAIIEGISKIAQEIQTFRAAGYEFYTEREVREYSRPKREKTRVLDVIEELLRERRRAVGL